MRAVGRRESYSSPWRSQEKSCPARIPAIMRMVEPELPQSRLSFGGCRCSRPSISMIPSLFLRTSQPSCRTQARVLAQSAPVEKLLSRVVPWAIAASMPYRCEIDLSPGSRRAPITFLTGRTIKAWLHANQMSGPSCPGPAKIFLFRFYSNMAAGRFAKRYWRKNSHKKGGRQATARCSRKRSLCCHACVASEHAAKPNSP